MPLRHSAHAATDRNHIPGTTEVSTFSYLSGGRGLGSHHPHGEQSLEGGGIIRLRADECQVRATLRRIRAEPAQQEQGSFPPQEDRTHVPLGKPLRRAHWAALG